MKYNTSCLKAQPKDAINIIKLHKPTTFDQMIPIT